MNKNTILSCLNEVSCIAKNRSPEILIFAGIAGMVSTVIMACQVTPEANDILVDLHENDSDDKASVETTVRDTKAVAYLYAPSAIMGGISIACFLGSYHITTKRTAALATAYSLSERTLQEYQRKVIETIGDKKEKKIRDDVAEDKIKESSEKREVVPTSKGTMLCYDLVTGRYFLSSREAIYQAEAEINRRLISEMYVSLNEFYDELELPHIRIGDDLGWNVDVPVKISADTSVLTNDGVPCLAIDYDWAPEYDYRRLM